MPSKRHPGINPQFYFATVEFGTRLRMNTADLWSLVRDRAENAGLASPGLTLANMNRLRAQAAAIRTSDTNLARATGNLAIGANMIGLAPWARDLNQRNALRQWQVRFRHTTSGPEGESTDRRTVVYTGTLPPTVDDLQQEIEQDAMAMAIKYQHDHVGVDQLSILEI